MSGSINRRDFLGMALGGIAAVGVTSSFVAMKRTWDPLPSVVSAGFTTVDTEGMVEGGFYTTQWRGKPVYIIRKRPDDEFVPSRDFKIGNAVYTLGIQICTHLGCIPLWKADRSMFHCPCHGGEFSMDGLNVAGTPPPRPFDIPPFSINGLSILLGEPGNEYNAMKSLSVV